MALSVLVFSTAGSQLQAQRDPSSRLRAEEVKTRQIFVKYEGKYWPVVGAEGRNVLVYGEDDQRPTIYPYPRRLASLEKTMPIAGHVTILDSTSKQFGSSGQSGIGGGFQTRRFIEFVTDRDMDGLYIAFFEFRRGATNPSSIWIREIGPVKRGEVFQKYFNVFSEFNPTLPGRTAFEFYHNGLPLSRHPIRSVALRANSYFLAIPLEKRIAYYRQANSGETLHARPFFSDLSFEFTTKRGIPPPELTLRVHPDGSVEILEFDERLEEKTRARITEDAREWEFFPALENGKPVESEYLHTLDVTRS